MRRRSEEPKEIESISSSTYEEEYGNPGIYWKFLTQTHLWIERTTTTSQGARCRQKGHRRERTLEWDCLYIHAGQPPRAHHQPSRTKDIGGRLLNRITCSCRYRFDLYFLIPLSRTWLMWAASRRDSVVGSIWTFNFQAQRVRSWRAERRTQGIGRSSVDV